MRLPAVVLACCVADVAAIPAQILPEHLSPKNMTPAVREGDTANALLPERLSSKNTSLERADEAVASSGKDTDAPAEKERPAAAEAKEKQAAAEEKAPEATQPKKIARDEKVSAKSEPTGTQQAQAMEAAAVAAVDPAAATKWRDAKQLSAKAPAVGEGNGTQQHEGLEAKKEVKELPFVPFEGCTFLGVYPLPAIDSPTQRLSTEIFVGILFALALVLALTGKCIFGGWLGTMASWTITLMGAGTGAVFGIFCWYVMYSTEDKPNLPHIQLGFITGETWWFWILFTILAAVVAGTLAYIATKMTALLVGAAVGVPVGAVIVMSYQTAIGPLPPFAIPCILILSAIVFAVISQCCFGGDEKGERLIAIATALVGGTLAAGLGRMIVCINGISTPSYADIAVLGAVAGVGIVVQLCLCSSVTFNTKKEEKK